MNDTTSDEIAKLLERQDSPHLEDAILRLLDKPLTAPDLREATERVAQPLELDDKDVVRVLVFEMGAELMAVPSVHVKQVTRATSVHRIPHRTNKIVRGLCNLDSELLLCADLATLLDLPDSEGGSAGDSQSRRMIVLGDDAHTWVVEVDAVRGVTSVPRGSFRRPPITADATLSRYTTNLIPVGEHTAALLDVERIISGCQAALR